MAPVRGLTGDDLPWTNETGTPLIAQVIVIALTAAVDCYEDLGCDHLSATNSRCPHT